MIIGGLENNIEPRKGYVAKGPGTLEMPEGGESERIEILNSIGRACFKLSLSKSLYPWI